MRPGPVITALFRIHSRPAGNDLVTPLPQLNPTMRISGRATVPQGVEYAEPAVGDPLENVQPKSWTKQALDFIKLRVCKVQGLNLNLLLRRRGIRPLYQGVWTALPHRCEALKQDRFCPLCPAPAVSSQHQRATVDVPVSIAQCQWSQRDRCQVRTVLNLSLTPMMSYQKKALSWKRKTTNQSSFLIHHSPSIQSSQTQFSVSEAEIILVIKGYM